MRSVTCSLLATLWLLGGCRDDFNSKESEGGDAGSTEGTEGTASTETSTTVGSEDSTSTGESSGDASSSDATESGTVTGEETDSQATESESESETGADLSECFAAGFSFPDGPPVFGQELRIRFTSQIGHAEVAFRVGGFVQTDVELVEPEPPFSWEAIIPGVEVPAGSAQIAFLESVDQTVAECTASY